MKNIRISKHGLCKVYDDLRLYFGDNNPDRLLEFLKEGKLKTYINYPIFLENSKRSLEPDFWEYFPYEVFCNKIQKIGSTEQFTVNGSIFADEEKKKFDTLLDAIVAKDISLLDAKYKEIIGYEFNDFSSPLTDEQWKEIVLTYAEWSATFEFTDHDNEHGNSLYEVYVEQTDYKNFKTKTLNLLDSHSNTGSGRPGEDRQWVSLYEQLIKYFYRQQEKYPAGTAKEQSKILLSFLDREYSEQDSNALLKARTIENKLSRIATESKAVR